MSSPRPNPLDPLTPEKIDDLVSRWAHNHQLYPGWVITPPDNRDTLWNYTRSWIEPILARAPSVAPNRALVWLQELTWRCEMCLVPLWTDYAARIKDALNRVRPFPDQLLSENTEPCETPANSPHLDWSKLSEAWIALALSLLRYYRETQASAEFESLAKELFTLSRLDQRVISFILYQRCLLAIERLDYKKVNISIAEWEQTNEADPFWLARRAAIRAETGNGADGELEADVALRTLRHAAGRGLLPASSIADLYSLSREGWIMLLIAGIRRGRSLLPGGRIESSRGRWDQLAALRCNPWVDLERLQLVLTAPPPRASQPFERTRSGFRMHFANEGPLDRLKPALQAARLIEEAGYPVRSDYVEMAGGLLRAAAQWLSDEDPERALPLLIRLCDDEALKKFLTDHRVALFETTTTDLTRATANGALDQAIADYLAVDFATRPDFLRSAERRSVLALELLAALAARFEDQELGNLLERALMLRANPRIIRNPSLLRAVDNLKSKTFFSMSAREQSSHLLSVISQPLVGIDVTTISNSWTEDASMGLRWPADAPERSVKSREWDDAIRRLLRFVAEGPETARAQALWRCAFLNRVGALKPDEQKELEYATWGSPGAESRPKLPSVPPWILLLLPEPQPGAAAATFKTQILTSPLTHFGRKVQQPTGEIRTRWSVDVNEDPLDSALNATAKPWEKNVEDLLVPPIRWTEKDCEQLVNLMGGWWERRATN